jgi:hypothetical protein
VPVAASGVSFQNRVRVLPMAFGEPAGIGVGVRQRANPI